jgi:hypothetical protein
VEDSGAVCEDFGMVGGLIGCVGKLWGISGNLVGFAVAARWEFQGLSAAGAGFMGG